MHSRMGTRSSSGISGGGCSRLTGASSADIERWAAEGRSPLTNSVTVARARSIVSTIFAQQYVTSCFLPFSYVLLHINIVETIDRALATVTLFVADQPLSRPSFDVC